MLYTLFKPSPGLPKPHSNKGMKVSTLYTVVAYIRYKLPKKASLQCHSMTPDAGKLNFIIIHAFLYLLIIIISVIFVHKELRVQLFVT